MNHAKPSILVVGGDGNWGKKAVPQLKECGHLVSVADLALNVDISSFRGCSFDFIYLIVPPKERADVVKQLSRQDISFGKIIIEKPNLCVDYLNRHIDISDAAFVDHYLFKPSAIAATEYFVNNKESISSIDISICESQVEERSWMISSSEGGGIVYDLGHHVVAILQEFFPGKVEDCSDIQIQGFSPFDGDLKKSERYVEFSLIIDHILVNVKLGKECGFQQKEIRFHEKNQSTGFDLCEEFDFCEMFADAGQKKLLSLSDIKEINGLLQKVHYKLSALRSSFQLDSMNDSCLERFREGNDILLDLFRHRHQFYWKTYFQVSLYFLFLLISPYLAFFYGREVLGNENEVTAFQLIVIVTSLLISLGIYLLLPRVERFLSAEDARLRQVHSELKKRMILSGIALDVPLQIDSNDIKIGNHSIRIFKFVVIITLLLSLFLPIFLIYMYIHDACYLAE